MDFFVYTHLKKKSLNEKHKRTTDGVTYHL